MKSSDDERRERCRKQGNWNETKEESNRINSEITEKNET